MTSSHGKLLAAPVNGDDDVCMYYVFSERVNRKRKILINKRPSSEPERVGGTTLHSLLGWRLPFNGLRIVIGGVGAAATIVGQISRLR